MSNVFLEFKERQNKLRLIKTAMIGGASGVGVGGLCLIFTKLDLLGIAPIFSLPIGIAALLIAGVVAYFALAESDRQLARELDERFDLKEKVQTMLAFEGEGGDMLALQRADANVSLSAISVSELKIKKIWIYITALAVAAAILLAGFLVPNIWKKNQNPPYRLTEYQEAGVLELIRYVDTLDSEYMVACLDLGHVGLPERDDTVQDFIRALGHDRLKALHVHDNDYVTDAHLLPYLGKMDWAEITQALADIDYDGNLTYEVAPSLINTTDDTFTALGAKFMADVGRHLINSIESKKKK